jgi:hypothetical protein
MLHPLPARGIIELEKPFLPENPKTRLMVD